MAEINNGNKNKENIRESDIAIIGISLKLPNANNADEFWDNIANKREAIGEFPVSRRKDTDNYLMFNGSDMDSIKYLKGGYLENIDLFDYELFNISPREASLMSPNQRLFLETAWSAIEDAGYGGKKMIGSRTGVYLAFRSITGFDYSSLVDQVDPTWSATAIPGNTHAIIPSRISYILDLKGPAMLIDTACSSSLVALHMACQGIRNKDCETAIVGGIQITLLPLINQFSIGIYSGDGKTRAFDNEAEGTCKSEGVTAILIKPLHKALEDRDNIYTVIKGSAINQDGKSVGLTAPNASAQEDVLVNAWENAGIDPQTITYLEAHGTATKIGDPTEILGLKRAFRRYTQLNQFCAIGSVKTNIGHTGSSAGLVGVIKMVLALKHKMLPPTINFESPNKRIHFHKSPVYVNVDLNKWDTDGFTRRCGVSSFGLSGTNCHIVLEEAPQYGYESNNSDSNVVGEILTISGKNKDVILGLLKQYEEFFEKNGGNNMRDICYTANTGRGHYKYRLAVVFENKDNIGQKICNVRKLLMVNSGSIINGKDRVYYAEYGTDKPADKKQDRQLQKSGLNDNAANVLSEYIKDGKVNNHLIDEICKLYVEGADIDWECIYRGEKRMKVSIPVYAFAKRRCWVEVPETVNKNVLKSKEYYYSIGWNETELKISNDVFNKGTVLVFNNNKGVGKEIANDMRAKGRNVIEVSIGEEYKRADTNEFYMNGSADSFYKLFRDINLSDIRQIVYALPLDGNITVNNIDDLEESFEKILYIFFRLTKAIQSEKTRESIDIVIIAENVNRVVGNEKVLNPQSAAVFGFGKVVVFENSKLRCRCIDIDGNTSIERVVYEIIAGYQGYMVSYRDNKRFAEVIEKTFMDKIESTDIKINDGGAYVITGGLGGIGLETGQFITSLNKANLVLINRTKFPEREKWDDIINENTDERLIKKINTIKKIESNGSKVICFDADVSDIEQMKNVFDKIRDGFGSIKGIIHIAGMNGGNLIRIQEENEFRQLLKAKINGTWVLDKITENDDLDFFVLFSSDITVIGGVGVSGYTSANAYMDSFSYYRNQKSRRTLTVNWPAWYNTGFSEGADIDETRELFKPLSAEEAVYIFGEVFKKDIDRIIIGELNEESRALKIKEYLPFSLSKDIQYEKAKACSNINDVGYVGMQSKEVVLEGRKDNYTEGEKELAQIWGEVLGFEKISVFDNFFEIGGDSIIAVKLQLILEKKGIEMSISDIAKNPVFEEMASHLDKISNTKKATIKIIDNIEPFSGIYFQSCFYNSLLPVVCHFGKNIIPFLINGIPSYSYDRKKDSGIGLSIEYHNVKGLDEICEEFGMGIEQSVSKENLVDDIISAISKDRLVVIWVDCFYESIRADTYLKEHLPHTWLIYGYDENDKTFNIVEHNHRQSLTYEKCKISFVDAVNSYKGYLLNFQTQENYATYYEFFLENTNMYPDDKIYIPVLKQNICSLESRILQGVKDTYGFVENFKAIVLSEEHLVERIQEMISLFNDIVNAKKSEKYILQRLMDSETDLLQLLDMVNELWNYIRLKLAKYMYSKVYDVIMIADMLENMAQIPILESKYFEMLIFVLDKY